MGIVTSLIVSFGDQVSSDSIFVMELDDVLNVGMDGEPKTSFYPCDNIFFLIHHEPGLTINSLKSTSGQIVPQGSVTRNRKNQLLWISEEDTHRLSYIPSSSLVPTWYGNIATGMSVSDMVSVSISGGVLPALCLAEYSAVFKLYKLIAPCVLLGVDEEWPIVVVAEVE